MKKLILQLVIIILVLTGLVGYGLVNGAASTSNCTIATRSTLIGNGISYNQVGTGRSILLLHGLFANKEQWESMMCQLSEAGYQVIAPDLPGYGNSTTGFSVSDYALENQVALLHQFMNKLGIESFDVAGSSMGGAIAALYSQRYPAQVRSLAFIGSPLGVIRWAKGVRKSIFEGVNPFIPITKEQFELEISLLFVTPPPIPDSVKAEKVNEYVTHNRHYQQVWDIVNLYDDVLCQKPLIQLPTLVIWGKEDRIYDIRGAEQVQRCISGSQIIRLPKAGHLLLMENAAEAASDYLFFLRSARAKIAG